MAHFTEMMAVAATKEEREARYYAAVNLVEQVDWELRLGVRHYRSRAGRLLMSLDEVVQAILDDNLIMEQADVEQAA